MVLQINTFRPSVASRPPSSHSSTHTLMSSLPSPLSGPLPSVALHRQAPPPPLVASCLAPDYVVTVHFLFAQADTLNLESDVLDAPTASPPSSSIHTPTSFLSSPLSGPPPPPMASHLNPDYDVAIRFLCTQANSLGLEDDVLEFATNKPLLL